MGIVGDILVIIIGISLGLIGSGGSILAVPLLVYIYGIPPMQATAYSLFIVGITAAVGVLRHRKMGNVEIKRTTYFAIPALIGMLVARKYILPAVPHIIGAGDNFIITRDVLIMVLFAGLMLLASFSMIYKPHVEKEYPLQVTKLTLLGGIIGVVTGFLGAGGGFLIIPSLVFFAGLPMKKAIGSSLLVISCNSLLGFFNDVLHGSPFDYYFLAKMAAFAIVGMFIGTALSMRVHNDGLKRGFGWFVLSMGVFILAKEIFARRA